MSSLPAREREESLEEGSEAESRLRLKRPVAHGAREVSAQTTKTESAQNRIQVDAVAEGRPQAKSGKFSRSESNDGAGSCSSAEANPAAQRALSFARAGSPAAARPRATSAAWRGASEAQAAQALLYSAVHALLSSVRFSKVTKELFQLAWPIAAAMLGETAIGLIDTKLVGGLGAGALGGVGLATTFMFLTYSMSYGAMRGVKVRVAHAIGEGNPHHGFAYARAGLAMGATFGVVVLLVCRDISPLLRWMGTDPELIPYAREFLSAVTLGAPATCAMAALIQHRQATGDSRTPMIIGITGNAFNALFAWALIYGHLGLPALGVRGAGYATATTEMLELTVMLALFVRAYARAKTIVVDPERKKPPAFGAAVRGVADLGIPTGLQFTAETLAFTAFTVVLGSISKEEIASHQIALNIIRVSFLPGVAVSESASVLVGRALGRRRLDEADAAVKSALGIAVGFMAMCGIAFAITGGLLGRFFSSDPLVVRGAQKLLFVAAVFQVLDAVNIVLRGALRGAKDVRAVAIIGVLVVWSFLPTSAYVLGKLCGLGALGAWIGFVGETTVGATLFWLRWKRGGWRKDYA